MAIPGTWAAWVALLASFTVATAGLHPSQATAEASAALFDASEEWLGGQAEWRMEATAHVASLVIRSMYCKLQLEPDKTCELPDKLKISSLRQWAARDAGWERILSSLSLYELARWFWQQQDFERSLVSADHAIALKLFPYTDSSMQALWQQALVRPGLVFKRPKLELADCLILKANGMFELGKRQKSVQYLHHALEAVHLSAALMNSSSDLVPEVVRHLETLSSHVGLAAADILQRMKLGRVQEILSQLGISCPGCHDRLDHLEQLVARLAIPLQVNRKAGGQLQLVEPSFVQVAYGRSAQESDTDYMQRIFTQLVSILHSRYLTDLHVPCTLLDPATNTCSSYLPSWVFKDFSWHYRAGQGIRQTEPGKGEAVPRKHAQQTGPPPLPPESAQHLDLDGLLRHDMPQSALLGHCGSGLKPGAAGRAGLCDAGMGWASEAAASTGEPAAKQAASKGKAAGWMDRLRCAASHHCVEPVTPLSQQTRVPVTSSMDAFIDKWLNDGGSGSMDLQQLITTLGTLAGGQRSAQPPPGSSSQYSTQQAGDAAGSHGLPHIASDPHTTYLPPLAPISKPPPPPPYRQCCPVFRRKLQGTPVPPPRSTRSQSATSQSTSATVSTESGSSTQSTHSAHSAHSSEGSSNPPPFAAHQHISSSSSSATGMDGLRQAVDRQLKEHLDRLTRGYQHERDDPLVVLTLTALTLLVVVGISVAKHRKRVARFLSGNKPFMQLQVMLGSAAPVTISLPQPSSAAPAARGNNSPGISASRALSVQQRRSIAAALRDAILGCDLIKLESTVCAAEEAGLEVGLVSRAKQLLAQRRKDNKAKECERQGPARSRGGDVKSAVPTPPAGNVQATAPVRSTNAAATARLSFASKGPSNKDNSSSASSVASSPASSGGNCSDSVSSYTHATDARDSPVASQPTSRRTTSSSTASSPRALYGSSFAADLEALGRLACGDADDEDQEAGWQQQASRVRRNRGGAAAQRTTGGGSSGKGQKSSSGGGQAAVPRGPAAMSGLAKGLAHPKVASMYASAGVLSTATTHSSSSGLSRTRSQEGPTELSTSQSSAPSSQSRSSHAQRRSGGWLDWISSSMLATSPTSSSTISTSLAAQSPSQNNPSQSYASHITNSPAGAPTTPSRPSGKSKSHTNNYHHHHHHHASDTSVLQQATPIRTSLSGHHTSQERSHNTGPHRASGGQPGTAAATAAQQWGTSPTGKGGLISTLSSWIGYGSSGSGPAASSKQPGGSASYSSVTASTTSQSYSNSPTPAHKTQAHGHSKGQQHHQAASPASSLAHSLPATLLDSPSGSNRPLPFPASKLNPDAPSFKSMKSPAPPAAPPPAASDVLTSAGSTGGSTAGGWGGEGGSAGASWQLPPHSNTSTASAGRATSQGVYVPSLSSSLACSNLTGLHQTPFHPTTAAAAAAIASKRLRSDPFAQPGLSRRQHASALLSHASVDHAQGTPSSELPASQSHSPAPSSSGLPTAGSITAASSIHHRSLPDHLESHADIHTDAAIIAANDLSHPSLSVPSMPLPHTLQGLSMFPGSSVWSPAAQLDGGWGSAAELKLPANPWATLPSTFAPHATHTLQPTSASHEDDLHGLGEELLQENGLAQDIMRHVVEEA